MTKSNYIWMLLALVCSLGFTACSSDDDESGDDRVVKEGDKTGVSENQLTDEESYLLDCQTVVMSVMRSLTGIEEVGPDVVETNHEPTYGVQFGGDNSLVRAVKCEDVDHAEQLFFAIVGLNKEKVSNLLTATSDGYSVSIIDLPILQDGKKFTLGTLTFHRGDGSTKFGSIDVEIGCIPHLESIEFVSANAFPENAGAAYHTGDVVWVSESSGYCSGYYVCVEENSSGGTLVHLNEGETYGDETINFDEDSQGCWIPFNNRHGQVATYNDCRSYFGFICYEEELANLVKKFLEGKDENKKPSHEGKVSQIFPKGFFDSDYAFHSSDGRDAALIYDACKGNYAWVPPYDYRHSKYAKVPQNCQRIGQVVEVTYKYVFDKEWDSFCKNNCVYTVNAIHFDDVVIQGAVVEFSALDYLED